LNISKVPKVETENPFLNPKSSVISRPPAAETALSDFYDLAHGTIVYGLETKIVSSANGALRAPWL
jgi:hypothetical protein